MSDRTCDVGGCGKPHRARGLCAYHYNQQDPKRHPKSEVPCVVCETLVIRRAHTTRRPTCSVACRTIAQFGMELAPASRYVWMHDVECRVRRLGSEVVESFDRAEIFNRDGWTCYMCSTVCTEPSPFDLKSATVDHVTPLTQGGKHSRANVKTACLGCNSTKQAALLSA